MVPGGIRNIHEGKVSGQMANAANHHSDRHGTEDYLNIVHRLSSEVQSLEWYKQVYDSNKANNYEQTTILFLSGWKFFV